jgi:hypothetical protein
LNSPIDVNPVGVTAALITELNRQHQAAVLKFTIYRNVQKALRNQLLAAIPSTYIQTIAHFEFEFGDLAVFEIVHHLYTDL